MDDSKDTPEEPGATGPIRRDAVADDIALARMLVIAPLCDSSLTRAGRREVAVAIAARGWEHPVLGPRSLSLRTVWRWYRHFSQARLDGLRPHHRRDRGQPEAITPELLLEAMALKRELPQRTVGRVIELLEQRGAAAPGTVARSTLYRHLAAVGLTGRRVRRADEPVRRFVAKHPGDVWQSDEKVSGPYLVLADTPVRTRIFAFLDDHSRLCCGIEAFVEGTEVNLERTFRRAVAIWGCPHLLYADNGKVYVSRQLTRICAELGVALAHAAPYRPESKGKIEKYWVSLAGFIHEANAARLTSLAALNEALWAWVEQKYNRAPHSGLGKNQTPFAAYTAGLAAIGKPSDEELERAFRHVEVRRVRKDGTFSFAGAVWEAPAALRGQEIELRFDPEDPTDILIYAGTRRLGRARPFAPPAHLPARREAAVDEPPRTALQSSRGYLEDLTRKHRAAREAVAGTAGSGSVAAATGGERYTTAMLLSALDRAEAALTPGDRQSLAATFDTFGPFDAGRGRLAVARAIVRWGKQRHLATYLRALVESHLGPDPAPA